MKCLVTGGAGFIGSHIAEELVNLGHNVRIIDDFSTGKQKNISGLSENIELTQASILDESALQSAVNGVDIIFHQAAIASVQRSIEDPITTDRVNLFGALQILNLAVKYKVKRVICASSAAVYGDLPGLPKKEDEKLKPQSPYALHKLTLEKYCQLFGELYDLETVCLRYFNVYGPRQDPSSVYSGVISIFIDNYIQNKKSTIFGDGLQYRDFIYIKDVVGANISAMLAENVKSEVFNVSCCHKITINHLIQTLDKIFDSKLDPIYKDPRKGDIKESYGDNTKLKQILKYEPKVGFEEGLRETVDWYRENGKCGMGNAK